MEEKANYNRTRGRLWLLLPALLLLGLLLWLGLSVKIGGKTHTLISGSQLNYKKNFTVSAGGADSVKIGAKKASCTAATVSGTGTVKLQSGTNVCKVICKASSGLTRTYKITINN